MAVNARTEEFQHIEVFDKPALFTNGRIARDTVPKGWYCYDIRGSDDDPGELCYMEENVVVNHAGSVLMPEKLAMPKSGRLDVRDELGFLDEGNMTLREFCEAHQKRCLVVTEGEILDYQSLPLQMLELSENTGNNIGLDLASVEKHHIQKVLQHTNGYKPEAARLLGIGLTTLYRKMETYGL